MSDQDEIKELLRAHVEVQQKILQALLHINHSLQYIQETLYHQ